MGQFFRQRNAIVQRIEFFPSHKGKIYGIENPQKVGTYVQQNNAYTVPRIYCLR